MPMQCSFVEHRNYKVVYRRYASLFFLVGVDNDEVRIPPALCPVFVTLFIVSPSHQLANLDAVDSGEYAVRSALIIWLC